MVSGVKNVMGGMLAMDDIHHKCMRKRICEEFTEEVVEMTEMKDNTSRSDSGTVLVPVVVKPRGRLRWIGDYVARGINFLADRLGLIEPQINFQRRQGGPLGIYPQASLVAKAWAFGSEAFKKIPVQSFVQ